MYIWIQQKFQKCDFGFFATLFFSRNDAPAPIFSGEIYDEKSIDKCLLFFVYLENLLKQK